jgi:hypothetical protein
VAKEHKPEDNNVSHDFAKLGSATALKLRNSTTIARFFFAERPVRRAAKEKRQCQGWSLFHAHFRILQNTLRGEEIAALNRASAC